MQQIKHIHLDNNYWCCHGGHWVPKVNAARTKNGRLICPTCGYPLRTKATIRKYRDPDSVVFQA